MATVGMVWNGELDKEHCYRGEGRYFVRMYNVISSIVETELIQPFQEGTWDILIWAPGCDGDAPGDLIYQWARESARKVWFIGWVAPFQNEFDRVILWHARALRKAISDNTTQKPMLWYPLLYPMDLPRTNSVIYSMTFPTDENVQIFRI